MWKYFSKEFRIKPEYRNKRNICQMPSDSNLYGRKEFAKTACCTFFSLGISDVQCSDFRNDFILWNHKIYDFFKNRSPCHRLANSMQIPKNAESIRIYIFDFWAQGAPNNSEFRIVAVSNGIDLCAPNKETGTKCIANQNEANFFSGSVERWQWATYNGVVSHNIGLPESNNSKSQSIMIYKYFK